MESLGAVPLREYRRRDGFPWYRARTQRLQADGIDELRLLVWKSIGHLFPENSIVRQTGTGSLEIVWDVSPDPDEPMGQAVAVRLVFERPLIKQLLEAEPQKRAEMAAELESSVHAGLFGYDEYATLPQARVIVLG